MKMWERKFIKLSRIGSIDRDLRLSPSVDWIDGKSLKKIDLEKHHDHVSVCRLSSRDRSRGIGDSPRDKVYNLRASSIT
jgi:hypothetical protein